MNHRVMVAALVAIITAPASAAAQELAWSAQGATAERLGEGMAYVGDQDGDGVTDLAVVGLEVGAEFVRLLSGRDGSTLRTFPVNESPFVVAAMPDLDGDGIQELLLGTMLHVEGTATKGMARIVSGATGAELRRVVGDDDSDFLGGCVGALSDIDGDGVPDFFAGAYCYANGKSGYARVYSGATGSILYTVRGDNAYDGLGGSGVVLNDLDGDGMVDFAIGTHIFNGAGYVRVYSGATGSILRTIASPQFSARFGWSIADAGDVDRDGFDDVLVLDQFFQTALFQAAGAAFLYSGATGLEIRRHLGNADETLDGGINGVGDVNGDGTDDYAIGGQTPSSDPTNPFLFFGDVRLYSGSSGSNLYCFREPLGNTIYGATIVGGVDLDGDGRTEIVISAPEDAGGGYSAGLVEVHGGNDLYLNIEPDVAYSGDLASMTVHEGVPGNLTIDALVEVNGAPTFVVIAGLGTFDATGTRQISGVVPPALAGINVAFRAFADDGQGRVIESAPEQLQFK